MRKYIALFLILFAAPVLAGEREELSLRIQVIQEHISRLNDALYSIPFEKKVYEDALKELQGKQAELNKTTMPEKNK